jgi:predicted membrane protein
MDLREARFSQRDVKIRAYAILGGVNIVVPEDIEVDVGGLGIMGEFDHKETGTGVPNAPRLRISGLAVMGGVSVRRKRKKQRPELEGGDSS